MDKGGCKMNDYSWQDRKGLGSNHNTCGYQNRETYVSSPTNCDPNMMTAILIPKAPADGDCSKRGSQDEWRHPWAAPGKAELWSVCGVNGGVKGEQKFEDPYDGLDLPPNTPYQWVRGQNARVGFTINKHHGGGYQYRMCPGVSASSKPSASCFAAHPLKF